MTKRKRRQKHKKGIRGGTAVATSSGAPAESQPKARADAPRVWAGSGGVIGTYIIEESEKSLRAYRSQPNLILEHANHEEDTARGGMPPDRFSN